MQWASSSAEASAVREVPQRFRRDRSDQSNQSDLTDLTDQERWALYAFWLEHESADVRANAIICLIHQANYLLDRQIAALEAAFVEEGGYSEQLAAARLAERERRRREISRQPEPGTVIPSCPQCGGPMVLRTARAGNNEGQQFRGCTGYPECRGVVKV
ncbi:four helix bundle suffix domain-containing protein [Chlorobium sp.]|uniref:four helix bundle suffix domain-containing protein n=1 Tax=Chlorobium sp. TaxID=1095 RepID=UPI002F3EA03D